MPIRVIIADDHPIVRDGLKLTIEQSEREIVVVGEASDGMQFLRTAKAHPADVYILDVTMPVLNGIGAARDLLKRDPHAKIIMLSIHNSQAIVEETLAIGARGYLTKDTATRNVVDAVCEVHAGRFYLSPSIAHYLVAGVRGVKTAGRRRDAPKAVLTGQEKKVLQLMAEGHSNKEMAALLDLSVNTIHTHRNKVMAKLGLHNQSDLVRYAIREGLARL